MARDRLVASNPEEISTILPVRRPSLPTSYYHGNLIPLISSGSFDSPASHVSVFSINARRNAQTSTPSYPQSNHFPHATTSSTVSSRSSWKSSMPDSSTGQVISWGIWTRCMRWSRSVSLWRSMRLRRVRGRGRGKSRGRERGGGVLVRGLGLGEGMLEGLGEMEELLLLRCGGREGVGWR